MQCRRVVKLIRGFGCHFSSHKRKTGWKIVYSFRARIRISFILFLLVKVSSSSFCVCLCLWLHVASAWGNHQTHNVRFSLSSVSSVASPLILESRPIISSIVNRNNNPDIVLLAGCYTATSLYIYTHTHTHTILCIDVTCKWKPVYIYTYTHMWTK